MNCWNCKKEIPTQKARFHNLHRTDTPMARSVKPKSTSANRPMRARSKGFERLADVSDAFNGADLARLFAFICIRLLGCFVVRLMNFPPFASFFDFMLIHDFFSYCLRCY